MNWTNALAIFGAVTGASGLSWQMWSHHLTGGRVEVLSTRRKHEGHWWVRTDVSNERRRFQRACVTCENVNYPALGFTPLCRHP
ncbi:hypothetical protein [Streptomyces sp. A5-4]|uniref:hypothetical protein n=1 Tax=Streptomyces sp. A5-4 TaxID=3384771 RepID=UPI003DA9C71B